MEGDEAGAAAAAAARIRVVRCPKCDKFLPELPAYSVYVCGGCGATLQAKRKNSAQALDNSDNGNMKYLEVLESVPETSEAMAGASIEYKSVPNRLPPLHSRSAYSRDNSRITREASTSSVKANVRDDVREAKYALSECGKWRDCTSGFYHQAACSCSHCYHREFLPVQGTPLGFSDQRAPYLVNSYGAYPVDGPLLGQQRLDVSELAPSAHLSPAPQNGTGDDMADNLLASVDERLLPPYAFSVASHQSQENDKHSNSSETDSKHTPLGTNSVDSPQSRDLPAEDNVISRTPSLPRRDQCGFSPSEGSGMGSRSTRSEHEKVVLLTETCKQNSIKDVCVANEMHSSDNEFDDPDYTQDVLNVPQDSGHTRATKAGDSFFSNLIKKLQNEQWNTQWKSKSFVNGFPILDRAVRKAEKLAGPIYPGDYWYDYRAGFWGVVGQPCLGMIPPYIPEFNYPMPKSCGGGNTGIYINGRELHQKDLDLLVSRGLSDSPERSYIVENSGKVTDEASGEELYGLGKLAPTVEKLRRGFGMRVPKVIVTGQHGTIITHG
ncbi:hypothetical protein ZWY2020_002387 [Hordeum vulgare]|nr:hypothetical protein ZWY2020_002387 [Hordeum vulgare]